MKAYVSGIATGIVITVLVAFTTQCVPKTKYDRAVTALETGCDRAMEKIQKGLVDQCVKKFKRECVFKTSHSVNNRRR